jgi:very-short-patch-repair endonuclease/ribosomal protein L40E
VIRMSHKIGEFHHTKETKKRISDMLVGRIMSDDQKKRISKTLTGHIVTDETRKKISNNSNRHKKIRIYNYCEECYKEISKRAKLCRKCNNTKLLKSRWNGHIKKIKMTSGKMKYIKEKLTRELLFDYYVNNKFSCHKIAKILNVCRGTVGKKLREFNIVTRDSYHRFKEDNPMFNKTHSEKWKEWRKTQVFPLKDTSIEVKIQNFLQQLKIEYFTHKYMNINHGYQCDIFIPSMNLVIECDGNYWHKYPTGTEIDHVRTKELIEKGFKVLRLWEFEIKKMGLDDFRMKLIENNINDIRRD